ncbi:MAG: hypothetical protein ABSC54_09555 [Smithellaceae bacterium]|jgi:predicted RNA-binding Zn-ribbon protein involved in translation (DUF1610 family)
MLEIQCPQCTKSFVWTDNMPAQSKCPTLDCSWHYNIHAELKRNIARRETKVEPKTLLCPFCEREITSKFTICPHCGQIVLGSKASRKSYFFLAVCLILIILSLVFKCLVK